MTHKGTASTLYLMLTPQQSRPWLDSAQEGLTLLLYRQKNAWHLLVSENDGTFTGLLKPRIHTAACLPFEKLEPKALGEELLLGVAGALYQIANGDDLSCQCSKRTT